MVKVNADTFIEIVRRSGLVPSDSFAQFLDRLEASGYSIDEADPADIAQRLVATELINEWHARNLLKGKYKGFKLGKYTLLGHIGSGGMSNVFLARHPVMHRLVAVKVLPKGKVSNPNYLERFQREARAAAALDHPNIVRAYDIDQDGSTHYIIMEYVDGRDFQRLVTEDGRLDAETAAEYIRQVAVGLDHAHRSGLIHRDIKPANCLVDKSGVVKILDMGLAKFSEESLASISAVYNDRVVGTADYLAPEQAVNSQTVDTRADIYSLGCTLYFLLTGHPPFPTGTIAERLLKHQKDEPVSIRSERNDVPATLVDICQRMMIKSPERRIQTASLVMEELTNWLAARGVNVPGAQREPSTSESGGFRRLGRFTASGLTTGSSPGRRSESQESTSDTSKMSAQDTRSVNDNLTLAPLEDERDNSSNLISAGDSDRSSSSSNLSSGQPSNSSIQDYTETHEGLRRLHEELRRENTSSGLLDNLVGTGLADPPSASNTSSKRLVPPSQLARREGIPVWVWLAVAAGIALGLFLVIALIVSLN
ncbi:MAG: serine/threonine-protein kinase [Pirellulaceae bacterium]|nr:serine/threonine protein kinase [Planctomycetales bacterium]